MKMWMLVAMLLGAVTAPAVELRDVVKGSGYFPVMIKLRSGDLLAVMRGGGQHVDIRGRLDMVSSKDGGKSWSAPWTVVDEQFDDRNPALGQLPDGTVLLAYSIAKNYDETGLKFKGTRKDRVFDGVYLMRSSDKGRTWTKPERSEAIHQFYGDHGLVSPYGKMAIARDGTLLMAVYFEFFDERGFQSYLFRSKDKGRTWGDPTRMGDGYNETGITTLRDGTLLAALRSGKGQHIAITRSQDMGRTWSAPVQATADMEHPGDLVQLRDGRVLLTYGVRNVPRGVHAMYSGDGGLTWDKEHKVVITNDAPNVDCGYPSSVELKNGEIATVFYQVEDAKKTPASARMRVALWRFPKQ